MEQAMDVEKLDGGLSALTDVLADMERHAFEDWFRGEQGAPYESMYSFAWAAWQARAKHQSPCRGVKHAGCNYLAACGSICGKCGQSV